jgi:hypothetical protein
MDNNKTTNQINRSRSHTCPQVRVGTNLRGGESLLARINNLNSWQKEYYKWYDLAKQKKYPPVSER